MRKAVAATAAQMMTADPRTLGRLAGVISRADVVRALAAGE